MDTSPAQGRARRQKKSSQRACTAATLVLAAREERCDEAKQRGGHAAAHPGTQFARNQEPCSCCAACRVVDWRCQKRGGSRAQHDQNVSGSSRSELHLDAKSKQASGMKASKQARQRDRQSKKGESLTHIILSVSQECRVLMRAWGHPWGGPSHTTRPGLSAALNKTPTYKAALREHRDRII